MEEKNINAAEECAAETPKEKKKCDKKELLAEIEALKEEIKEKDDKYLRMAAEYDNFRRRSREEKDALYESSLGDTVEALLPIIDNLERAALYDDGEKVKEGLAMTAKAAQSALEALGVEKHKERSMFEKGDMVKITTGPMSGFTGKVDSISENGKKITVLASVFGRETPVELDASSVQVITE